MTATEFAAYLRRVRETNDPGLLAELRDQLDREHGEDDDAKRIRFMLTTERVSTARSKLKGRTQ